ncbi:substrate-binding domain-containing protein [Candidatus Deferrimicrobium sp.]|uniref:substrate-binding domain-containing protein n=1 Tax=Candidatus Deferrimicrobium sp. TaxID=3060586 RepID=UPI002722C8B4|nr:substrate-binding domain-containing protein [Candidatus Deferrimicrobium sp.]MDO8739858.1 substrate-binding domain-containing protein [Candidatus Deferrimicrobium sp.]
MRRFSRIPETLLVFVLLALATLPAGAEERLRMSTTTSTENSSLLAVLLPPFEKKFGCKVDVVAVGTGKALKLGEAGDVDVVFVHARKLEDKFVAGGFGVNRRDVMYNDFVLLGPPDDPAGVGRTKSAPDAFRAVAAKGSPFISRGDESGTHQKEKEVWASAGIAPRGAWYVEAGQGMGEVITMATQKRGYTLSDRGTYIAFRKKTDLVVVRQGDNNLWNPYGIIAVNPKRHAHVKYDLAMELIDFVTGPEGQSLIAGYKVDGEPLFFVQGKGANH